MTAFRCWKPDHGTEDDTPEFNVEAFSPESAAEVFAKRRYYEDEYPRVARIHVRSPDGGLAKFDVETINIPDFLASKVAP